MCFSYIFYFSDRTGLIVVASSLSEAIAKLSSEQLSKVVKLEVPPFEVF